MLNRAKISGRQVLLVGLALAMLAGVVGTAQFQSPAECPTSPACFFTGRGVVRVIINSDSDNAGVLNAGVRLDTGAKPAWSVATYSIQARQGSASNYFQIYSEYLQREALFIDSLRLNVTIPAGLAVGGSLQVSGTKSFVQSHPTDPAKEIVYVSLEGPEAGTYIRGTAKLVNGEAVINLPEHFSLVTNDDGLTVQLTPLGEWLQLYIVQKSTKQIIVREASGKSGQFDYLVQGIREGFENHQVIRDKEP
jgi:hypothetical protein